MSGLQSGTNICFHHLTESKNTVVSSAEIKLVFHLLAPSHSQEQHPLLYLSVSASPACEREGSKHGMKVL